MTQFAFTNSMSTCRSKVQQFEALSMVPSKLPTHLTNGPPNQRPHHAKVTGVLGLAREDLGKITGVRETIGAKCPISAGGPQPKTLDLV